MSISDTTLPVSREVDGSYQLLDGHAYGVGDLLVNSYEKSPYTDTEIISLDVGPTQTRYRVHRAVLSQSPELAAKPALKLWGEKTNDTIPLPELDETTAHTLVHYLYTGRYQTLKFSTISEKGAIPEYRLSTCVYCAAIRYKLSGLAELAKEKITSFGEDLTILEILGVARENAFPLLPEDEAWYPAYLEDAIKGAVAEDPGLFTKRGFVDQIEGDRKFRQVVMAAIVNTLSRGTVMLSPARPEVQTPATIDEEVKLSAPSETKESEMREPEPTAQVEDTPQEAVAEAHKETASVPESVRSENVKLDEIEPTLESPEAPEPFTDELDSRSSKMYQQMSKKPEDTTSKKSETATSSAPVADVAATRPVHKRTDSVMQPDEVKLPTANEEKKPSIIEEKKPSVPEETKPVVPEEKKSAATEEKKPIAPMVPEEPKSTPTDPTDATAVIVDGTNGNTTQSKKSKKKKKKAAAVGAAAI